MLFIQKILKMKTSRDATDSTDRKLENCVRFQMTEKGQMDMKGLQFNDVDFFCFNLDFDVVF